MQNLIFRRAAWLLISVALAIPTLAGAQSFIEYEINGARVELTLGEPEQYTGDTFEALFEIKTEGADGEFLVSGVVLYEAGDSRFLGWAVGIAVLGEALELPRDGYFAFDVQGTDVEVYITEAETFDPTEEDWVATMLNAITPVAIVDGIFLSPDVLRSTMSAITGVPVAENGNLLISFEEVDFSEFGEWQVTVEDFTTTPIVGAHVTNVIPDDAGQADIIRTGETDGDGIIVFEEPEGLPAGTQVYFVATNPADGTQGATLVTVPAP